MTQSQLIRSSWVARVSCIHSKTKHEQWADKAGLPEEAGEDAGKLLGKTRTVCLTLELSGSILYILDRVPELVIVQKNGLSMTCPEILASWVLTRGLVFLPSYKKIG